MRVFWFAEGIALRLLAWCGRPAETPAQAAGVALLALAALLLGAFVEGTAM